MTAAEYVIEALGGAAIFKGGIVPRPAELREQIEQGLPYRSLESVRERLQLTVPEFASVLNMPARTLARRKQARKLDPDESDRLYRLARMAAHAVAVFGTEDDEEVVLLADMQSFANPLDRPRLVCNSCQ